MTAVADLKIVDLAAVVYSSGKVFDGLRAGLPDTQSFLRSGDLSGITSRADLALLEDMRDVSALVIGHIGTPVDAGFVVDINATLTRSASIFPGRFRTDDQNIGVATRYGQHLPGEVSTVRLGEIIEAVTGSGDVHEDAMALFLGLAAAQPFMDGNKRTALFAANALLLNAGDPQLLTIPVDDDDPTVADHFNDLLARYYIFGEDTPVKAMLRDRGFQDSPV